MQLIDNLNIRNQINACLLYTSHLVPELAQSDLSIDSIDALCQVLISDNQIMSIQETRKNLSNELSIAYFGTLAVGLMSFSIQFESLKLIDIKWIEPNTAPDPNVVLGAMLNNITNYMLGVIRLVESGLESPARTCLRSMLELSWLTLVVVGNREKMVIYTQNNDNDAKDTYFKHFSSKKVLDAISNIEKELDFPDEMLEVLRNIRRELYSMYSENVHHAYGDLIVGSLSYSFDEDDTWQPNLFGKSSKASHPTLYHMNDALFVLFGLLIKSLELYHNLTPPYSKNLQNIISLIESFNFLITNREKETN